MLMELQLCYTTVCVCRNTKPGTKVSVVLGPTVLTKPRLPASCPIEVTKHVAIRLRRTCLVMQEVLTYTECALQHGKSSNTSTIYKRVGATKCILKYYLQLPTEVLCDAYQAIRLYRDVQSTCAYFLDSIGYNGINCAPVFIAAQSQQLVGSETDPGKAYLSPLATATPLSCAIAPVATARARVLTMLGPTTAHVMQGAGQSNNASTVQHFKETSVRERAVQCSKKACNVFK